MELPMNVSADDYVEIETQTNSNILEVLPSKMHV